LKRERGGAFICSKGKRLSKIPKPIKEKKERRVAARNFVWGLRNNNSTTGSLEGLKVQRRKEGRIHLFAERKKKSKG